MGLRGPKPVERERLTFLALQYASFLYTLREGRSEIIKTSGRGGSIDIQGISEGSRQTREFIQRLETLSGERYEVVQTIQPHSGAWEQLKRARTEKEIRRVAESIRRWAHHMARNDWQIEFPRVIADHAKDLLRAKKSWNYPRKGRPKSDDKRVLFLAKVLAGFMLGISSGYATKLLGSWGWSKEWIQGPFVAMEKSFGGRVVDFRRGEKSR